ncbi:MAG: transposase [Clostridia bacterium]|nr:transposase [Clostridia bacterium]
MDLPKRKPTRLKQYNYSTDGAYFVTICTKDKRKVFGKIVGGGALDAPQMILSEIGGIVDKYIQSTNNIPEIVVDKYVIMPNHIHLLLRIENGTSRAPSPTNQILPHAISTFKRFVNRDARCSVFQRSYHDHIIRDEADYRKIWNYIDTNPAKWQEDCFYVED